MTFLHIVGRLSPLAPRDRERLWRAARRRLPDVVAATLMPDHFHAIGTERTRASLAQQIRAHHREGIARWEPLLPARPIDGPRHLERAVRYTADNAPRDELVDDPIEWPWSTYQGSLGLVLDPWTSPDAVTRLFRRPPTPQQLHAYVSGDPSVRISGTPFPAGGPSSYGLEPLVDIAAAVALAARWASRCEQRRLLALIAIERRHRQRDIADHLAVTSRTVERFAQRTIVPLARQVVHVALGDARLLKAGRMLLVDGRLPRGSR